MKDRIATTTSILLAEEGIEAGIEVRKDSTCRGAREEVVLAYCRNPSS